MKLLDRLADRIHAKGDAAARAAGLTVIKLPGGGRRISDPRLPAVLEARRRHVILHAGTRAALAATRKRMASEYAAAARGLAVTR
jgi:hypothetical protein